MEADFYKKLILTDSALSSNGSYHDTKQPNHLAPVLFVNQEILTESCEELWLSNLARNNALPMFPSPELS